MIGLKFAFLMQAAFQYSLRSHPNVVRVYGLLCDKEMFGVVMEVCQCSLAAVLYRGEEGGEGNFVELFGASGQAEHDAAGVFMLTWKSLVQFASLVIRVLQDYARCRCSILLSASTYTC